MVELYVTATGNAQCKTDKDTIVVIITPSPTTDAGLPQTVCATSTFVKLKGSNTNASGVSWSTTSGGNFNPSNTIINPNYNFSAADYAKGYVDLVLSSSRTTCLNVVDTVRITLEKTPVLDAGNPISVCSNNNKANLAGSVTPSVTTEWFGGAGTFTNKNNLITTYTPTQTEVNAGSVFVKLKNTNLSVCIPQIDSVKITFTPAPTISITAPTDVCANNTTIPLSAKVTIATNATWSAGGSAFTPAVTGLTTNYSPTNAEITAGKAIITATTTNNAGCLPVATSVTVLITPKPVVDAGPNTSVCANSPSLALAGKVSGATTTGVWSTSGGTYSNPRTQLNNNYTLSPSEISNKTVSLVLTSTNNGKCLPAADTIQISVTPAPTINAGPDLTICEDKNSLTINGNFTTSGGAIWSTQGTGAFSQIDTTTAKATYSPSSVDKSVGQTTLILTTVKNGKCLAVKDTIKVLFDKVPLLSAGPDISACSNEYPISIKATGVPGNWVSGNGTFSPNKNSNNILYTPSLSELNAGAAFLRITSLPNGSCPPVFSDLKINLFVGPTITVTQDTLICGNAKSINLKASFTNAQNVSWTHLGSGSLSNATGISTTYTIHKDDTARGFVNVIASTINSASCKTPAVDTIKVSFQDAPNVNAGLALSACKDRDSIRVVGNFTAASGITWTSSGSGTFSKSNLSDTYYKPSSADTAKGSVYLKLSTQKTGVCNAITDSIPLTFTPTPQISTNPVSMVCANVGSVSVSATVKTATGVAWSTSSNGVFNSGQFSLNASYVPSAFDRTKDTLKLTVTTTGNGDCKAKSAIVAIPLQPLPTITANDSIFICADTNFVPLQASVNNATGATWTSSGTGSFNSQNPALGTASYILSHADSLNGRVNLTATTIGNGLCPATTKVIPLIISPSPVANAGNDFIYCTDVSQISLNASIQNAGGIVWKSSGTGGIQNFNSLNTFYFPSAADRDTSKTLFFYLSTTQNDLCKPALDTFKVNFSPAPTLTLPANITVCADSSSIVLPGKATYTVAQGIEWTTTGKGSFTPSNSDSVVKYLIAPADTIAKSVQFTATTFGNGLCQPISKQFVLTILDKPYILTKDTVLTCANNALTNLSASFEGASNIKWSSDEGNFSSTSGTNVSFTPSNNQIQNGFALVKVEHVGTGLCKSYSKTIYVKIAPAPNVDAGFAQTICADKKTVSLTGTITNATNINWTTSGTGTFSPDSGLSTTYTLSSLDSTKTKITFYSTTSNLTYCKTVKDSVVLNILPVPLVSVSKKAACGDLSGIPISGTITGVSNSGKWTSTGTGFFSPNNQTLNAVYYPSQNDINAGNVILKLEATNIQTCSPKSNQINVSLIPTQSIYAGPDRIVCQNNASLTLNGTTTNIQGTAVWKTLGSGIFADSTKLTTTYTPTAADFVNGFVKVVLKNKNTGLCPQISDTVYIQITPSPTITGIDKTICADLDSVALTANVVIATGRQWTSLTGGTVHQATSPTLAQYIPSTTEKNNGFALLRVNTLGNGLCLSVIDTVKITITPKPTITLKDKDIICADIAGYYMGGSVTTAKGIIWSSNGQGNFAYQTTDSTSVIYNFGGTDITKDSLLFTGKTTQNGACKAVSSSLKLYITPAPIVSAQDILKCVDKNGTLLSGTSTIKGKSIGGKWTSLGSGSFVNDTIINTTYFPSDSDMTVGSVNLVLQSLHSGLCNDVTDTITLSLLPAPVALAGNDSLLCTDQAFVDIKGKVTNAGEGIWQTANSGNLSLVNPTAVSARYTFTNADYLAGFVDFVLQTNDHAGCLANTDSLRINLTPKPVVTISSSSNCISAGSSIVLTANIQHATKWIWSQVGDGSFDNVTAVSPTYTPGPNDIINGKMKIVLTTTEQGICNPIIDSLDVIFNLPPTADAGTDTDVCADTSLISLTGTISNSSGGKWRLLSGNGTFSNIDLANATADYIPGSIEKNQGFTILILEALSTNNCDSDFDTLKIDITPIPTLAIDKRFNCSDAPNVTLRANSTIATNWEWTAIGDGGFTGPIDQLNTVYQYGANDLNNQFVWVHLKTTAQGKCRSIKDSLLVHIIPPPLALITGDTALTCSNKDTILVDATIQNAGGGIWTAYGFGSVVSLDSINANLHYLVAPEDLAAGKVSFQVITIKNGVCNADTSFITYKFIEEPTLIAPENFEICANETEIN